MFAIGLELAVQHLERVEPRVGDEAETLHQRFNRRFHEVRTLHKYGPVARLA